MKIVIVRKINFWSLCAEATGYDPQTVQTSVSQPLWDRGPVNSFIIRRGLDPTDLLENTFPFFLSSYIKLT